MSYAVKTKHRTIEDLNTLRKYPYFNRLCAEANDAALEAGRALTALAAAQEAYEQAKQKASVAHHAVLDWEPPTMPRCLTEHEKRVHTAFLKEAE